MTQKATHWISECSPEQCSLLAQKESALAQAQARIAALEAQLATARSAPDSLVPPAPNLAQRYKKLLACSGEYITLLDAQGQICYTNDTVQLLGYSSAADAGLTPLDCVRPEDRARLQAFIQTLAATPNSTQILEVRGRQKDGHEVWLEIKGNNLLPDPDVNALVLTSRNITEAKQTLAALQHNETIFRQTFEQAAVGIAHIGCDLKLLRINQRYGEIMGYTQAELDQHGVADYTHPTDMARDRQAARQLLAGEISAYHTQKRYLHKDGYVDWVNLTVSLVRTPDGQPDFFISVVEDISQLKQTEAALQRSSERYQRIVEDQLDMICRYNADFQLTFVNQAFCTVLGKSAEELVGINFLTLTPPGESECIRAKIQTLHSDHPVATSETVYALPNGELHWFEWVDRALL